MGMGGGLGKWQNSVKYYLNGPLHQDAVIKRLWEIVIWEKRCKKSIVQSYLGNDWDSNRFKSSRSTQLMEHWQSIQLDDMTNIHPYFFAHFSIVTFFAPLFN